MTLPVYILNVKMRKLLSKILRAPLVAEKGIPRAAPKPPGGLVRIRALMVFAMLLVPLVGCDDDTTIVRPCYTSNSLPSNQFDAYAASDKLIHTELIVADEPMTIHATFTVSGYYRPILATFYPTEEGQWKAAINCVIHAPATRVCVSWGRNLEYGVCKNVEPFRDE